MGGERSLTLFPSAAVAPSGAAAEDRKKETFELLLSIYQRPYGEDRAAAWTAFIAIYTSETADEIIASAHRWVAARPADKLRKLETWLGNGAWKKQPPPKKQTRGSRDGPSLGQMMLDNLVAHFSGKGALTPVKAA